MRQPLWLRPAEQRYFMRNWRAADDLRTEHRERRVLCCECCCQRCRCRRQCHRQRRRQSHHCSHCRADDSRDVSRCVHRIRAPWSNFRDRGRMENGTGLRGASSHCRQRLRVIPHGQRRIRQRSRHSCPCFACARKLIGRRDVGVSERSQSCNRVFARLLRSWQRARAHRACVRGKLRARASSGTAQVRRRRRAAARESRRCIRQISDKKCYSPAAPSFC